VNNRDEENVTYIHSLETLYSEQGLAFQREKYLPKIGVLRERFGERFARIKLLDVGVGYGVFLHILEHEHGLVDLYGMDPFPASIEIARRYTGAEIRKGSITDVAYPFDDGSFDAVTCFDVLEHLEEPGAFFSRIKRYLRDGGIVIVTTPNRDLPYLMRSIPFIGFPDRNPTHINVHGSRFWKRLAVEHRFEVVASWKGEHLTHIRLIPKVLMRICSMLRLDHRRIPLVNAFEQSFCMVLELPRISAVASSGGAKERL
jgi:SAM-dependent methyltransferase